MLSNIISGNRNAERTSSLPADPQGKLVDGDVRRGGQQELLDNKNHPTKGKLPIPT